MIARSLSWAAVAWLAMVAHLAAAVAFDPLFSPGMVMQRDVPVRLAGTGPVGSEVKVSIDDATPKSVVVGQDGTWNIEFPAMPAGGPHVFKAADAVRIHRAAGRCPQWRRLVVFRTVEHGNDDPRCGWRS